MVENGSQTKVILSELKYKQLYYWPQKKFPVKLILKFLCQTVQLLEELETFLRNKKLDCACEQ